LCRPSDEHVGTIITYTSPGYLAFIVSLVLFERNLAERTPE
jgi:hypothetical protein